MGDNRQQNKTENIVLNIDGKTPTINHLHGHNKFGAFYLKPEAKKLKQEIMESVHEQAIKQGFVHSEWSERLLSVSVVIHEDWWTKKHTIKRKDIANREKFLIDSIFDGLGLEDSHIWKHTLIKADSKAFRAVVNISFYAPNI